MIHISQVQSKDYNDIILMFEKLHILHSESESDFFRPFQSGFYSQEVFEDELKNENIIFLKASIDSLFVGFSKTVIVRQISNSIIQDRDYGKIEQIYVEEAYTKQGIGTRLIQKTEEILVAKGISELELIVWNFNQDAVRLYEKLGMTPKLTRFHKKLHL